MTHQPSRRPTPTSTAESGSGKTVRLAAFASGCARFTRSNSSESASFGAPSEGADASVRSVSSMDERICGSKVSATPVADMSAMTSEATTPLIRCSQKSS